MASETPMRRSGSYRSASARHTHSAGLWQYGPPVSAIGLPIALLIYLVPVLIAGFVLYLAVRYGVRHGMRDARTDASPPPLSSTDATS